MRVLHVVSSLNRISGVANVVMNYYRELRGSVIFDFLMYDEYESSFTEEVKSYGSRVFFIPKFGLKTYFEYKRQIDDFIESHAKEYDIIHIHEIMSQKPILKAAKKYHIKTIIHSHGRYPGIKLVGFIKGVRNKVLLSGFDRNANYYIACSNHAREALKHSKHVDILFNGVNADKYKYDEKLGIDVRQELGIDLKSFVVGHIGRMTYVKNSGYIIDVFNEILKLRNDCVLVLAGDGDLLPEMKEKAKRYCIDDNIKFLGNRKDVDRICQALDCFIMPSFDFEGLPVILVEIQSNGLKSYCSTNVPKEANMIDNMQFIDLADGEKNWAKHIVNGKNERIDDAVNIITAKGYNIKNQSLMLLDIYNKLTKAERS